MLSRLNVTKRVLPMVSSTFNNGVMMPMSQNYAMSMIRFKSNKSSPQEDSGKKQLKGKKERDTEAEKNKKLYQLFGGNQAELAKRQSKTDSDSDEIDEDTTPRHNIDMDDDEPKKGKAPVDKFDLDGVKSQLNGFMSQLEEKLSALQLEAADPALIEDISVPTLSGGNDTLAEISAISLNGPYSLEVELYDDGITNNVVNAIQKRSREWQVRQVAAGRVLVQFPKPTQQKRQALLKQAKTMCDQMKVRVREVRDQARKQAKAQIKSTNVQAATETEIQKLIDNFNIKIDNEYRKKEKETKSE